MDRYSIVLDGGVREPLEGLAASLGFTWGERGNVKEMVKAIASGQLPVGNRIAFSESQSQALGRAAIAACLRGDWQDALLLGDVFQAFQANDAALSGYVAATLEPLRRPWVAQLFECIEQQQPFKLAYRDAADRPFEFSVCGGQLVPHERRTYLDCWCIESEGNQDIPPLQHNWSLRLDRIVNAELIPLEQEWRSLDTVLVQFELSGGLAYAYEQRPEDTQVVWDGEVKTVSREITNTFWFIRQILPYGKDCRVVAPAEVSRLLVAQLQAALEGYQT